jgi:hypothetical protein
MSLEGMAKDLRDWQGEFRLIKSQVSNADTTQYR